MSAIEHNQTELEAEFDTYSTSRGSASGVKCLKILQILPKQPRPPSLSMPPEQKKAKRVSEHAMSHPPGGKHVVFLEAFGDRQLVLPVFGVGPYNFSRRHGTVPPSGRRVLGDPRSDAF